MADFPSDGDDSGSSSARSESPEWELLSSTPGSPLPESMQEASSSDSGLQELLILGLTGDTNGLLQDDYFACVGDSSDVMQASVSRGERREAQEDAVMIGVSSDLEGARDSRTGALPLSVLPESDGIGPPSPPHSCILVTEENEDVSCTRLELQEVFDDLRMETGGVQSPRGSCQVDLAFELCTTSGPSAVDSNTGLPWDDMKESVLRIHQSIHDRGHSFLLEEGAESVVGRDPELFPLDSSFGLGLGDGVRSDADEPNSGVTRASSNGCNGFPCESWLRRQLAFWQAQVGQPNTLWSIALAAAVMGLLILGQGWQRLRAQNLRLRLQLCAKDKKISQLMFQLIRMKESLSKTRRLPVIRAKSAFQSPEDRV